MRVRGTVAESSNLDVQLTQRTLGADVTVLKIYDPGYVSIGFGLRVGADWVQQSFETKGVSPDRNGVLGRAAPIVRLELPFKSRYVLMFSGFVDGVLLNGPLTIHWLLCPDSR